MATFRCIPMPTGHQLPAYSGTVVAGPTNWTIVDEASANGDILRLDVQSLPAPVPGYQITHLEIAVSDRDGNTTVSRVLGGPAVEFTRRVEVETPGNPQRVLLRTVQHRLNQFTFNSSPDYQPSPGDVVLQPSSGASATVKTVTDGATGTWYNLVLENISGQFETGADITVDGNPGRQQTILHNTHLTADQDILRSEWSLPRDVTPVSSAPRVTVTASRTDVLQGEAVVLEAYADGFQCTRPEHELHYHFTVDAPAEQGSYAALPDFFEDCFGAGSNNRVESYSSIWAFAPRSTGTVTVTCTVRDRSGYLAVGTVELNVSPATDVFADADIYAASSALRPVPGAPGANVFVDMASLKAALPSNGEALILLDRADVHGQGLFDQLDFRLNVPDALVMMPYDASGVGPAAGGRARLEQAIRTEALHFAIFGVDVVGPFDPTDPFSITQKPDHGLYISSCAHAGVAEINITGWDENIFLPFPDNTAAYVDVYNTDFFNFGWHVGDVGRHALAGCFGANNPQAWRRVGKNSNDDNETVGFFTDHGPYRASRPRGSRGISKSVFFSCCSWGGTDYTQHAVRFFGNANTDKPYPTHCTEILTEAGREFTIGSTAEGAGEGTAYPQNFVVDKGMHLTAMQPGAGVSVRCGGVTVRNFAIGISSNPAQVLGSGMRAHFTFSNANTIPGQLDCENNPVVIEYCTLGDLRVDSGQNTQSLVVDNTDEDFPLRDVTISNLLTYAPNFTQSDLSNAPVETTPRWTPMYEGEFNWEDGVPLANQTPITSFATPPEATATFRPLPGSAAIQGAVGDAPYDDLQSTPRPSGAASRGAYEP